MARRSHSKTTRERQWLTLGPATDVTVNGTTNFALKVIDDGETAGASDVASWLGRDGTGEITVYARRRFTIAATHCFANFWGEDTKAYFGAIGLGVQGLSQSAGVANAPRILQNNTPRAFPAIFPWKISGIGQYTADKAVVAYSAVGLSKGQRIVQLGQAIYGSLCVVDSAAGQPSVTFGDAQPLFRILCLL